MALFLPLFYILMLGGAWSAWRRSPLYSTQATLKVLGLLVLVFAVFIGIPKLHLPENVFVAIMISLAILGGPLLIVGIIRITDKHVADLPPSAKLTNFHRHKVQRWFLRALVAISICAAVALALMNSDWVALPLVIGGLLLILSLAGLTGGYMNARRMDLRLSKVLAEPWVHWQFSKDQWQFWAKTELAVELATFKQWTWKREGMSYIKTGGFLLVVTFAAGYLVPGTSLIEKLILSIGLTAIVLGILLLSDKLNRRATEHRYEKIIAATPEVWFGSEGVFFGGKFLPWYYNTILEGARVVRDPLPILSLLFREIAAKGSFEVTKRILIPEDAATDLALLQQNLTRTCPKAAIHLL